MVFLWFSMVSIGIPRDSNKGMIGRVGIPIVSSGFTRDPMVTTGNHRGTIGTHRETIGIHRKTIGIQWLNRFE